MITWMYRKYVTSPVGFVPTFTQIHPNHNYTSSDTSIVLILRDYPAIDFGEDSSSIDMTLYGANIIAIQLQSY